MTHLLNTDVILNQLHDKSSVQFSQSTTLSISVITYGELLYGADKSPNPESARNKILHLIEALNIKFLPLTQNIVEVFSKLKVQLEKKGAKLADFDLLIAATALEQDLILVTENKRHFSRITHLKLA